MLNLLLNFREQISSLTELGHHVVAFIILEHIVYSDDVRVRNFTKNFCFSQEIIQIIFWLAWFLNNFDSSHRRIWLFQALVNSPKGTLNSINKGSSLTFSELALSLIKFIEFIFSKVNEYNTRLKLNALILFKINFKEFQYHIDLIFGKLIGRISHWLWATSSCTTHVTHDLLCILYYFHIL